MEGAAVVADDINPGGGNILSRALDAGAVVFLVLLSLITVSVFIWAVIIGKWVYLRRLDQASDLFVKSFWDSRSLNDLNGRLADYSYSPVREVFRSGYSELIKSNSLRELVSSPTMAVTAALDNLNRSLAKVKLNEKRSLEKHLSLLAISASACPFIGLFGTVWGIMNAFEGIARTGNASLSAVAPGISEALIATAFGLAAAIPAAICYNIFIRRIRNQMITIESFVADFMNIVERYLVSDKSKQSGSAALAGQVSDKI
jgi:biopolymer transport protein TolQ